VNSVIRLKSDVVDHAIFLIVFFYGVQSLKDSLAVTDVLVACAVVANAITTLDASGVLGWNIIPVRTENIYEIGRVQGAFGEANQHAAMVVMLLPVMVVKVMFDRGASRMFWAAGVLFSLSALLMTVSRGAMVGLGARLSLGRIRVPEIPLARPLCRVVRRHGGGGDRRGGHAQYHLSGTAPGSPDGPQFRLRRDARRPRGVP
jgi:hypothetical protein